MLHLIYSLGVNLDTISLLTFNSIDDDGKMKLFNTQKGDYVVIKLNENLLRDINHFKGIMKDIKQENRTQFKCYLDKVIIIGDFIFECSPTGMYNRFARRFGLKLMWFKYTPDQVLQLSISMSQKDENIHRDESLDLFQDSIKYSNENNG